MAPEGFDSPCRPFLGPANQQEASSDLVSFGPVKLEIFLLYRRKRARTRAA